MLKECYRNLTHVYIKLAYGKLLHYTSLHLELQNLSMTWSEDLLISLYSGHRYEGDTFPRTIGYIILTL